MTTYMMGALEKAQLHSVFPGLLLGLVKIYHTSLPPWLKKKNPLNGEVKTKPLYFLITSCFVQQTGTTLVQHMSCSGQYTSV